MRRARIGAYTASVASLLSAVCAMLPAFGLAQEFSPEQIKHGADLYAQNCSPCHGARMLDPNSAFDLRKFPPAEKNRFVNSVTKGLNAMPPWGDILKPVDIEALWAYVRAGER
jgi:mono/diheme cytochrome c family protein